MIKSYFSHDQFNVSLIGWYIRRCYQFCEVSFAVLFSEHQYHYFDFRDTDKAIEALVWIRVKQAVHLLSNLDRLLVGTQFLKHAELSQGHCVNTQNIDTEVVCFTPIYWRVCEQFRNKQFSVSNQVALCVLESLIGNKVIINCFIFSLYSSDKVLVHYVVPQLNGSCCLSSIMDSKFAWFMIILNGHWLIFMKDVEVLTLILVYISIYRSSLRTFTVNSLGFFSFIFSTIYMRAIS